MNRIKNRVKLACCVIFLVEAAGANPVPVLVLGSDADPEITWKQVFDSGFRPKHLPGLESGDCVTPNQAFEVKLTAAGPTLELPTGRTRFEMVDGTTMRMIWHQGYEPLTMQEGARQVQRFKDVFGARVNRDIRMPRQIDASGRVDAGNDENDIRAQMGKYMILYGFDNSHRTDKPLIPHFYIFRHYPGMPDFRNNRPGFKIPPPEGYEWYSLDPAVDTPSPGVSRPAVVSTEPSRADRLVVGNATAPLMARAVRWIAWLLAILAVLVVGGLVVWRLIRKKAGGGR